MGPMDTGHLHAGDSAFDSRIGTTETDVYGEIVDHAENTEKTYYEQQTSTTGSGVPGGDPDAYVAVDASLHLKIQSLPILDNLVG